MGRKHRFGSHQKELESYCNQTEGPRPRMSPQVCNRDKAHRGRGTRKDPEWGGQGEGRVRETKQRPVESKSAEKEGRWDGRRL